MAQTIYSLIGEEYAREGNERSLLPFRQITIASPAVTQPVQTPRSYYALTAEDYTFLAERKDQAAAMFPFRQFVPLLSNSLLHFTSVSIVLVSEDTIFAPERSASERSLIPFRQITVAAPVVQPFFLTYRSPSPSLFGDAFAMAYSKAEYVSLQATTFLNPPHPFFVLRQKSPPPELFFDAFAMAYSKAEYVSPITLTASGKSSTVPQHGYTFVQPDFCDDPWLEWPAQHPPPDAYPFRQIYPPPIAHNIILLMFHKAPHWRIEAELDSRPPLPGGATLYPFVQVSVFTPPAAGFRVQAVTAGFYGNDYKDEGDVFDLASANDFSDATVSYVSPTNPDVALYGWMLKVPASTPLFSYASAGASTTRTKPRRTIQ